MIKMQIGNSIIGIHYPPFIVAEISGNHNQSLERALAIVEATAHAGANAIKLQTYTTDTMTIPCNGGEFFISDEESLWKGKNLYELYMAASMPWEWHAPIMRRAEELGIICFSTPFDITAVDFLETLKVPAYKIASFEIVDLPLIRKVAATGKPVIISTGMATVAEIDEAVCTARDAGCNDLVLLKCTSTYPASPENSNILTIPHMRVLFDCEVGLSDHTLGIGTAIAAVAHGATVIEKHFTLSREDGGVDSAFSMEPGELRMLVEETKRAWESIGCVMYGLTEAEKKSLVFRRSLYVVEDMNNGDVFTKENLRCIRPGFGLEPKYYDILLGKRVNRDIARGTAMKWEYVI
jgi:N-acetylneuraminate synthase